MRLTYRLRCITCVALFFLALSFTCQFTFNDLVRDNIPIQEYSFRCILAWVWLHYIPCRILLPEHFTSLNDRLILNYILTLYGIYEILRYTFIEHLVHKIPYKEYFIRICVVWLFLNKLPYRLLVTAYLINKQRRKHEPRSSPRSQPDTTETMDSGMVSNVEEDDYCDDWDTNWELDEYMLDNKTDSKTSLETKSALVPQPRPVYRKPVQFKIKNIMVHFYGYRRATDNNNTTVVSPLTVKAITPVPRLDLPHGIASLSKKLLPTLYFGLDSKQQQDKPVVTGLTSTKVVQYGLTGVAIGLGGYIVYKTLIRK